MRMVRVSLTLVCLLGLMSVVMAQGRFSIEFKDTPLSNVLEMLKRHDPNLQFAMGPNLGDIRVTASLVDVTVDEALQIVLNQAGLMSVRDAGVYQIREKPERQGPRAERPAPRFPAPVFMNRPTAPGAAADGAAAAGAAPGAAARAPGEEEEENLPLRLIIVKYADPADMAFLFGGDVIEGGGMYGGGGSGGSSGGYGGSSGGSSGYGGSSGGSSRGSSGSSRGSSGGSSSRSSGSSSRSSGSSSRSSGGNY